MADAIEESRYARFALRCSNFAERWFPDSWVFAAHAQGRHGDNDHGEGGEYPGVREPALGKIGVAQGKSGIAAFFDSVGHESFLL